MRRATIPSRDEIAPDTPLRLDVAAAIAFPDGSMTASGLRREGKRGRLAIERIAGKDYTTLSAIERMRELCRVKAPGRACILNEHAMTPPETSAITRDGAFGTAIESLALAAARTTVAALKKHSRTTSPPSTPTASRPASVHQLSSRSPTSSRSTPEM
jgi:hypothetical protein